MARLAFSPLSLREAVGVLAQHRGQALPLAGGTDVVVNIKSGRCDPGVLLSLHRIDELRGIEVQGGLIRVGAMTTHAQVAASPTLRLLAPALAMASAEVGSPAIRNRGTIGGNVVTGSPAGDTLPPLYAMDAVLELAGPYGTRRVAIEGFHTGPQVTVCRMDEILVAIELPIPRTGRPGVFLKRAQRKAQAIAKISLALCALRAGDRLADVRVALGAVAPTVIRAPRAEAILEGAVPTDDLVAQAAQAVIETIRPIDDIRSSAWWRRRVSGVLLKRAVEALLSKTAPA